MDPQTVIGRDLGLWATDVLEGVFDVSPALNGAQRLEVLGAPHSTFAPGRGGWDGERGPSAQRDPAGRGSAATVAEQAALHRLTGDRHLIDVEPAAARAISQPRPILHGLCPLGGAVGDVRGGTPLAVATGRGPVRCA